VYAVREVPLEFGTKGTVADGYELVDVMSEKSTIKIAGPNADKIDSIVIPSELINVAGANSDVTVDVDILAQLPSGVFLYNDGDATMKVTAYIEQLVTNTYRLPVSEIDKNNIPEGYTAEITDQSVNISVVGLQKNQESFSLDGLNAYVDLKNTVEGNNEVILKLTLPDGLRVLTEVRVNVLLTKNVDDTYTTTSDMTSDSQEETT
jgi:YbbR domain-containing protein